MIATADLKQAPSGASDMAHIVLTFDNNKLASALYARFVEDEDGKGRDFSAMLPRFTKRHRKS